MKAVIRYNGIERETQKAVLVDLEFEKAWLPKSQIEIVNETAIFLPYWLAKQFPQYINGVPVWSRVNNDDMENIRNTGYIN